MSRRTTSPEARPSKAKVRLSAAAIALAILGIQELKSNTATANQSHLRAETPTVTVTHSPSVSSSAEAPIIKTPIAKKHVVAPKVVKKSQLAISSGLTPVQLAAIKNGCFGSGSTPETTLQGLAAEKNPKMGNIALLCAAEKFDNYGYAWGGGHEADPAQWMQAFNAHGGYGQPFVQIFDCAGIIHQGIYDAFGQKTYKFGSLSAFNDIDVGQTTDASGKPLFRRIPLFEVKPGDVIGYFGHVEVAAADQARVFFGAENGGNVPQRQIETATIWDRAWTDNYRYVGPGSTIQ